jgi:hypothetical protein
MKILLILLLSFYCKSTNAQISSNTKPNPTKLSICFWNVKNLSESGLERDSKGPYIIEFSKNCDFITFSEIRSAKVNMAEKFEQEFKKNGEDRICKEGTPKGKEGSTRKEKYLSCIRKEIVSDFETYEYEDETQTFSRPPTFFLTKINDKKILVINFHSVPGDKDELIEFEKVVLLAKNQFSEYYYFFGGDFNTGTNYQKKEFLENLFIYKSYIQVITEGTTFANQTHDQIFILPEFKELCIAKVWKLEELFQGKSRKELEKISDHFPVSVSCEF